MIGAIIVLYNPEPELFRKGLEAILPQVDRVCIVDNSSEDNSEIWHADSKIDYFPLKRNIGIAAAQNIGIKHFMNMKYDYVVFSDQDSVISFGLIEKLSNAILCLEKNGIQVGVVGTRAINRQTNKPYPAKSKEFATIYKEDIGCCSDLTECYSVRSSISMISTKNILNVGGMDESLFIDGVDHEWCWRAWHKLRLRSFIVEEAKISHMLGEGDRHIGTRNLAIANTFRIYFQFRNFLWLIRRDYTPSFWKRKHAVKYIIKMFYYPLFISPRVKYLQNIFKGIMDGILKYNNNIGYPQF